LRITCGLHWFYVDQLGLRGKRVAEIK
jgi:hypothetical protein